MRAFLTEDFIDALLVPEKGELWVADTQIRGFGLRLYASGESSFCIRTKDINGKTVRRTFKPYRDMDPYDWYLRYQFDKKFDPRKTSSFLQDAREWATMEIGRLKGKILSEESMKTVEAEYTTMKAEVGEIVKTRTIGQLVDLLYKYRKWRGWKENYADRLMNAFSAFDRKALVRDRTIGELDRNFLWKTISATKPSPGNLRLLRSLFKVLAIQVESLGGPRESQIFPRRPYWISSRDLEEQINPFLKQIGRGDLERLFVELKKLPYNWRSLICIEICIYTRMPITQVMSGRWSELVDGYWVPTVNPSRKFMRYHRIGWEVFKCLEAARINARADGVESDYWFPSEFKSNAPIANIDRTWFALLDALDWPQFTLSKFLKNSPLWMLPIWNNYFYPEHRHNDFQLIEAEMSKWLPPSK